MTLRFDAVISDLARMHPIKPSAANISLSEILTLLSTLYICRMQCHPTLLIYGLWVRDARLAAVS